MYQPLRRSLTTLVAIPTSVKKYPPRRKSRFELCCPPPRLTVGVHRSADFKKLKPTAGPSPIRPRDGNSAGARPIARATTRTGPSPYDFRAALKGRHRFAQSRRNERSAERITLDKALLLDRPDRSVSHKHSCSDWRAAAREVSTLPDAMMDRKRPHNLCRCHAGKIAQSAAHHNRPWSRSARLASSTTHLGRPHRPAASRVGRRHRAVPAGHCRPTILKRVSGCAREGAAGTRVTVGGYEPRVVFRRRLVGPVVNLPFCFLSE